MYNFEYNRDQERRNSLLNIEKDYWYKNRASGGDDYIHYENLDAPTLKILLDEKFADPKETQNESPSIQEFYDFMADHPMFTAHGYVIGLRRDDYRVSIEGLEGSAPDGESLDGDAIADFASFNRMADEFDCSKNYCRSWWD